MPLSEQEQRMLDQMERALYVEDPRFASAMERPSLGTSRRRRLIIAVLGVVAGLGILLLGSVLTTPALGVLGFCIMFAAAVFGITGPSSDDAAPDLVDAPVAGAQRSRRSGPNVKSRMEERWERRQRER